MGLTLLVKSAVRSCGYDVRRLPQRYDLHASAYYAQQQLLQGRNIEVIFDLGAHFGESIKDYREWFCDATIYSFEPCAESFQVLSRSYRDAPKVKLYQAAVTDKAGKKFFFTYKSSARNSLLPVAVESERYVRTALIEERGSEVVPTTTLDDFCTAQGIERIQILKMDIQGGERMALQGAAKLLGSHSIDLIYTEVLFANLYEGQADFCELRALLKRYDYTLFDLYNLDHGKNGTLAWGDAIFTSPDVEASWNQIPVSPSWDD